MSYEADTKVKDEEKFIWSFKLIPNASIELLISTYVSLLLESNKEAERTGTKSTPLILSSCAEPEGISFITIEDVPKVKPVVEDDPVNHFVFSTLLSLKVHEHPFEPAGISENLPDPSFQDCEIANTSKFKTWGKFLCSAVDSCKLHDAFELKIEDQKI